MDAIHTAIIVDDEPIIRMDLRQMVEALGIEVLAEAGDGFDAIELCRQFRPDVILMDIQMPAFDGLGAAETILSEQLAGCVVMITAYGEKEFLEYAGRVGVGGYLIKPIEERLLYPTISMAYQTTQRFRESEQHRQQVEEKLQAIKVIEQAKIYFAAENEISEAEAYRRIQKLAMEKRCTMESIATAILKRNHYRENLAKVKQKICHQYAMSEPEAYRFLCSRAKQQGLSLQEVVQQMIAGGLKI